MMDIDEFKKLPVMGILRGAELDIIEPLTASVISAGLKTIEIAMNTQGAPDLIRAMKRSAEGRLTLGAGTVLTINDLHSALDAGAEFIVLPVLAEEVVEYCVKKSVPVFPGGFTPREVFNCWKAGAAMVKVFPSGYFGPSYFKELKGPFNQVELLACGGVNPGNISDFFSGGASAVAFGASIFKKDWLTNREFNRIEESIRALVMAKNKGGRDAV